MSRHDTPYPWIGLLLIAMVVFYGGLALWAMG